MSAAYDFEPLVGEIRALRTFRVGPGGVLYPLFGPTPWRDGENVAYCRAVVPDDRAAERHEVPDPDCSCGFYAYGDERAASEYPHARYVLAVVACWGVVITATRGVRAQRCRIEAIWLSDVVGADLVAGVREHYPSLTVYADRGAMLEAHPLTVLDSYDPEGERSRTRRSRVQTAAIVAAVLLTAAPYAWWSGLPYGWGLWTAALAAVMVSSVVVVRRVGTGLRAERAAQRRRLQLLAVVIWMLSPTLGVAGTLLLRVPLLQILGLVLLQRHRLAREAARFPARIE